MIGFIKKKTSGFLMLEAIFAVFVTALVVVFMHFLLTNIIVANKMMPHKDDLVFSYLQLDRFLNENGTLSYPVPDKSSQNQAVFIKIDRRNHETEYKIQQYKNMLRTTTDKNGHMPLLLQVKKAAFETNDQQIKIKVTEMDGRDSELIFKMHEKPKEKKKS